jgi:hypothetical protein
LTVKLAQSHCIRTGFSSAFPGGSDPDNAKPAKMTLGVGLASGELRQLLAAQLRLLAARLERGLAPDSRSFENAFRLVCELLECVE